MTSPPLLECYFSSFFPILIIFYFQIHVCLYADVHNILYGAVLCCALYCVCVCAVLRSVLFLHKGALHLRDMLMVNNVLTELDLHGNFIGKNSDRECDNMPAPPPPLSLALSCIAKLR